jgi:hypothetical protein
MTNSQSPSVTSDRARRRRTALSTARLRALFGGAASIIVLMLALALAPAQSAQAGQPPLGRQDNRADYLAALPSWVVEGTAAQMASEPSAVAATFNVTWANDESDAGACGSINPGSGAGPDGQLSLREAICEANNSGAGPHVINLPAGTYTLSQAAGELPVSPGGNQTITISGAGSGSTTVQATNTGCPSVSTCNNRVFDLDPNLVGGVNVTIQNLTIAHGRTSDSIGGAGIISGCQTPGCPSGFDSTTVSGVTFNDNLVLGSAAGAVGGGVQNIGGTLIVQNSTFTNNDAGVFRGGGIYYDSHSPSIGTFTVSNSSFTGNKSGSSGSGGGAIYETAVVGSTLSITGSTFSGNQATGTSASGAAVYKDGGATLNIDYSTFVNNQVLGTSATVNLASGGGIATNTGTVNVSLSRFFGNTVAVAGHGGGVWTASGATTTATNNWWGCNGGANAAGCDTVAGGGANAFNPWITLTNTASPGTINVGQSTTLTASFLQNSNSSALTPSQISVLIGLPVMWGSTVQGLLSGQQATIQANGAATATFTSNNTCSNGSANATVDNGAATGTVTVQCSDLTITKTHAGDFTQGQTGAIYTLKVTNSGTAPTNNSVTVVDTLPAGLTATAISGTGWGCTLATLICTRGDALGVGANYDDITLTVDVATTAGPSVTNTATVAGGGEVNTGNNTVNDPTTIVQAISETKCGLAAGNTYNFTTVNPVSIQINTQGTLDCVTVTRTDANHPNATPAIQTGRYWTINGTASGGGAASGYEVTLTLPQANLPSPSACKYLGSGTWDCDDGTHTTSTTSTVTRSAITGFSDWAVGSNVPTAVSLAGFTARVDAIPPTSVLLAGGALGLGGLWLARRWRQTACVPAGDAHKSTRRA